MELAVAKNIRERIGIYLSEKSSVNGERKVKAWNLNQAGKIGVIYDATSREDHEKVKKFIHFLREEQKDVLSLGYINSKNPDHFLSSKLSYRYFTKKDLNWLFQPKEGEAADFLEKEFDILIDLSIEDCFPIRYLCNKSEANFKVGAQKGYRSEKCDMLIDISSNPSVDFLIIQIKHYLKLINKQ